MKTYTTSFKFTVFIQVFAYSIAWVFHSSQAIQKSVFAVVQSCVLCVG